MNWLDVYWTVPLNLPLFALSVPKWASSVAPTRALRGDHFSVTLAYTSRKEERERGTRMQLAYRAPGSTSGEPLIAGAAAPRHQ